METGYESGHAVLRIEEEEFRINVQVMFRKQGLIGVKFHEFRDGEANFMRIIQKLSLKAFGISGIKGKW
jgi:hypothetical protein